MYQGSAPISLPLIEFIVSNFRNVHSSLVILLSLSIFCICVKQGPQIPQNMTLAGPLIKIHANKNADKAIMKKSKTEQRVEMAEAMVVTNDSKTSPNASDNISLKDTESSKAKKMEFIKAGKTAEATSSTTVGAVADTKIKANVNSEGAAVKITSLTAAAKAKANTRVKKVEKV